MKTFFKTVAFVTVFSVCEKFLGFMYRVFLSRTIGAEGIGLDQVALSVFGLFYTIACSGIPITVSRLMTKYRAENDHVKSQKVITAGFMVTLAFAIPLCIIFYLFKDAFSFLFSDPRCEIIFSVILPGLSFTCVYSVLRGVFWGNKKFLPYSIIELLEEAVMIIVGIILISFATSPYSGALRAGIAVLVSYLFSFTVSTIIFFAQKNKLKNPKSELKPLLKSAMPVTAMRTANTLTVSLVSIILPLRLISAGYTNSQAISMYGSVVGQAFPLLSVPGTAVSAFTLVLMPEISEFFYKKDYLYLRNSIEKAIKITVFVACLFIPIFFVLGEEIGIIIFGNAESGKYLSISAYLMLFMGLSNITTSILNSMGLEHKTLLFFIISGILMIVSIWVLPQFIGIYSLLVGFTFVFGLSAVFNMILLSKSCPKKPRYLKFVLLSSICCIPTAIFGIMLKSLLLGVLGTVLTFFLVGILTCAFGFSAMFGLGVTELKSIKRTVISIFKKKKARS